MKLPLIALNAETKSVTAPTGLLSERINWDLIAQAVHVYRSNKRQGGAKTKTRGEVILTGAKWYKQKGTGNARHGAKSAPLFVGGGVAHGPRGNQNWKRSLPPKMLRAAVRSALSALAETKTLKVIADLEKIEGKAKAGEDFMKNSEVAKNQKVLLVIDQNPNENIVRAFSNHAQVSVTRASRLNALELVRADEVIVMQSALDELTARLTATGKQEK